MLAAEEMGTKGVRAMTPLDTTLANALRVKLGKGRDLPEEPKPKRPARAKTAAPAQGDAEGELKKVAHPRKKAAGEDEAARLEVKPAATIVKPKPSEPTEAPEPLAPVAEVVVETKSPVVVPPPVLEPPAPPKPVVTPAPPVVTPPPPVSRPATPPRPEPKIVPYRPLERPAAPPPSRPGPRQPFAPPRVVSAPPRPPAPPRESRPPQPAREPVRPAAAAAVAPPEITTRPAPTAEPMVASPAVATIEAPPADVRRELVKVGESVTVAELAEKMRRKSGEVIKALLELGVMRMVNDLLDPTEAKLVGDKFGFDVEIRSVEGEVIDEEETEGGQLSLRPPVVTVMGHVDHGKTSLLDAIRKSKVAEKEFGGITQHIGAYQVATSHGKVTFLDTPGHEAFTAMRARGAQATDIVILVVAADDGVMPQTVEAINHARAANVPIIVAVNKVDKPEADPDRVKRELSNHNLVPEDWGGQTIYVPTSAKKGTGIEQLLEMSALQAEILELKANPNRAAKGVVIESRLDRGRGPVATVLVQTGTLKEGDAVVVGANSGRIRALLDPAGRKVKSAGPSDPVEILGLSGVPSAGAIIESDVRLASASNAIVLGFNVKPEAKAAHQAQAKGVDVRMYNVIYEAINDVKAALAGMLAPEIRETLLGRALVRQIFVISKLGPIAGSYVQEGKIVRTAKVRVRRGDSVVGTGTLGSLKRFKDDVREVLAGLECGIGVDGVNGVQAGDLLEAFTTEEVARTL